MRNGSNANVFWWLGKLATSLALIGLLSWCIEIHKERTEKILGYHIGRQITLHLKNRIGSHESLNLKKWQSVLVIYEENWKYTLVEEAFSAKHFEFSAYRIEKAPWIIFVISWLYDEKDPNYKLEDRRSIIDVNFI